MPDQTRKSRKLEEGLRLHQAGSLQKAKNIYTEVLAENPNDPDAHHFIGLIAHQTGDFDEAVRMISRAVELEEDRPTFYFNLGGAYLKMGQRSNAIEAYKQAVHLKPDWPEVHYNLGSLMGQAGHVKEAEASLRRAIELNPKYPEALSSLGIVLNAQGKPEQAAKHCQQAVELAPDLVEAWTNLGNALEKFGRYEEAESAHREAIGRNPDYVVGHYNLGNLMADFWRHDEAVQCFRNALEISSQYFPAINNLLFNLLYDPNSTETSLFDEHIEWASQCIVGKGDIVFNNNKNPDRRLRIGYVSSNFCTHSCAYFLEPLFSAHKPEQVEIFAYANVINPDEKTKSLKSLAHHWRDISALDENDVCSAIQADQIDVLVDLAGHSANNCLKIFRAKPAPIQVAWLGYPATTGMVEVDYRITDVIADPLGEADQFHTETLIRLPDGFLCYAPALGGPGIEPPPSESKGYVTFGSFNNLLKVTPKTIETWAGILQAIPGSRLVLKGRILDVPQARENILNSFDSWNIERQRIKLAGWIPQDQMPMGLYQQVDIALDTFPYNGTTTTFEALWMGVPVVTIRGERHAGRVGTSILSTLELNDLVAESVTDYQKHAIELAQSPERLKYYRESLRNLLGSSPLMDGPAFARKLEAAIRKIWHQWCLT